jgi:metal transporter CNNM
MFPLAVSLPVIVFLVMLSGLFSGLTLGLMGLDLIGLQTMKNGGTKEQARCAARIAPVRKRGNQLLCTLLLGNVAVNSALSVLLADISSGIIGFLVSTALIVTLGEILPQAACSRYALQIGSATVPLVKFVLALFYIVAKPMSILLDWLLGKDIGVVYSSSELIEMVKLQVKLGATDEEMGMMAEQVVEGALNFRNKCVEDVMTPLQDAYMLPTDTRLGYDTIRDIFQHGFSRVPVYGTDKHDYRGLLCTKDLMLVDPEDEMLLGDFIQIFDRKANTFTKETKLFDALNKFKKGQTHLALVREMVVEDDVNPRCVLRGVLSLEDIVEEILQEEIVDEHDAFVDVAKHVRVAPRNCKPALEIFNPVWRMKEDRLSHEEVKAIAAHLSRTVFIQDSSMSLELQTIEWLVSTADVQNRDRRTLPGVSTPDECDWLYHVGEPTDKSMLVLQGRIGLQVGREGYRSEAGSFMLLGKEALVGDQDQFYPDFGAFICTPKVRFIWITKGALKQARVLDLDPGAREQAIHSHSAHTVRYDSRAEHRQLRGISPKVKSIEGSPSEYSNLVRQVV